MTDVVIAGIGKTPVGEHYDRSLRDLALAMALKDAGNSALRMSCLALNDIDLFVLRDSCSRDAVRSLEAVGFAERAHGWQIAQQGELERDGRQPVATFYGMKARGNPGGAARLYQVVEATRQLRGQAGPNQAANARRALIQCLARLASAATVYLMEAL
jgi:acetyl-CoA C-acetyltransferase